MRDYNPFLEANKNLSEKIDKLRKENQKLWYFKEKFLDQQKLVEELKRQLDIKRTVVRVVKTEKNIRYILRIDKVFDTHEGMFIEVS